MTYYVLQANCRIKGLSKPNSLLNMPISEKFAKSGYLLILVQIKNVLLGK